MATDFTEEYPVASAVVLNDFYVDDVITAISMAKELESQLIIKVASCYGNGVVILQLVRVYSRLTKSDYRTSKP